MVKRFLLKHRTIIILLFLALLLRFPWLYSAIEQDEGQFGYITWRWMSGDGLYTDLIDNKPPLLYTIYYAPIFFFGNSIIPVRVLNNLLFLVSVIFFFELTKNWFTRKIAFFSTLFYTIFMNIPPFEGYLAMSESLLMPFLILSVYCFEKYISTRKEHLIFASSFFASLSLLIKQQAVFIFFLLIGGLFIYEEKNKIRKIIFVIFVPLVIIILVMHLLESRLFLDLLQLTWIELTQSPMGFASGYMPFEYNFRILLAGSGLFLFSAVGLIKILRSVKKEREYFLVLWLSLASLFTLIPPAYGHYYLFLIPPGAIFAGIGVVYSIKAQQNKRLFILLIIILLLVTELVVLNNLPNSNLGIKWLEHRSSSLESYNQQIRFAEFIKNSTNSTDEIFISGWEPTVYWLSERLPFGGVRASYHPKLNSLAGLKNQGNLTLVIFFDDSENVTKHYDFLSDETIIYGVKVYNKKVYYDPCYLNIVRQNRDKNICEFVSAPLKPWCFAYASLNVYNCYNITNPVIMDECFTTIALEKKDGNICNLVRNADFLNYCESRLKEGFNYTACINSFSLAEGKKWAEYTCRIYYARFVDDIHQCDYIKNSDKSSLCKERVTSNQVYCENILDIDTYAYCMADATLDANYCMDSKKG
jgi:hypothetical protein